MALSYPQPRALAPRNATICPGKGLFFAIFVPAVFVLVGGGWVGWVWAWTGGCVGGWLPLRGAVDSVVVLAGLVMLPVHPAETTVRAVGVLGAGEGVVGVGVSAASCAFVRVRGAWTGMSHTVFRASSWWCVVVPFKQSRDNAPLSPHPKTPQRTTTCMEGEDASIVVCVSAEVMSQ